jgi:hypothetical protein
MLNSITSGSNKRSQEGSSIELTNPRTDALTEPGKDAKAVVKVNLSSLPPSGGCALKLNSFVVDVERSKH